MLRAVAGTLLGLLAFAALEGALFHAGWYTRYLEPNSTTGQVEYRLYWLRRAPLPKTPDVLVIGDSRIAEGFSAPIAQDTLGGRVHFTNFGMPGATPRVWYYTLRDINPSRFSTVVIPFDTYSDHDPPVPFAGYRFDPNFLAGRLRLSDCPAFAESFDSPELRRLAAEECAFRGLAFRSDLFDLFSNMSARLARAKVWREQGAGYVDGYGGKPEDLRGLTRDPVTGKLHLPPGLKPWQSDTAGVYLTPDHAPQTGATTEYRRRWIGAILDIYKDAPVRIIFIRIPRAPLPVADPPEPARFVASVAGRPHLTILPPDLFRDLQQPELFADGLHLNHAGRELFSRRLAENLAPLVR